MESWSISQVENICFLKRTTEKSEISLAYAKSRKKPQVKQVRKGLCISQSKCLCSINLTTQTSFLQLTKWGALTVKFPSRRKPLPTLSTILLIPSSSESPFSCFPSIFRHLFLRNSINQQKFFTFYIRFNSKLPVVWTLNFQCRFDYKLGHLSTCSLTVILSNRIPPRPWNYSILASQTRTRAQKFLMLRQQSFFTIPFCLLFTFCLALFCWYRQIFFSNICGNFFFNSVINQFPFENSNKLRTESFLHRVFCNICKLFFSKIHWRFPIK